MNKLNIDDLKLFHLSQSENTDYDTYDSCVVAAYTPKLAIMIHPNGCQEIDDPNLTNSWCRDPKDVEVKFIGVAAKHIIANSVICSSFNAG